MAVEPAPASFPGACVRYPKVTRGPIVPIDVVASTVTFHFGVGVVRSFNPILAGIFLLAVGASPVLADGAMGRTKAESQPGIQRISSGVADLKLDQGLLAALGWSFATQDAIGSAPTAFNFSFDIGPNSSTVISNTDKGNHQLLVAMFRANGALLLSHNGERKTVIGGFIIHTADGESWTVLSSIGSQGTRAFSGPLFFIEQGEVTIDQTRSRLRLTGKLTISVQWAQSLGFPEAGEQVLGDIEINVKLGQRGNQEQRTEGVNAEASDTGLSPLASNHDGPDVFVRTIHDVDSFGEFDNISAFSIGTVSCNIGTQPASWFGNTNQHPVIAQNMFRSKAGRFEQIGMSWLKHGFFAVSNGGCTIGCTPPPQPGDQLGIGCSDPYSAGLNGQQSNLGPRSDVNPLTGDFLFPWSAPPAPAKIGRRIQVNNNDIDPDLNPGAIYYVEAQYIVPGEPSGNRNNNASFRRADIIDNLTSFELALSAVTNWRPAIQAWQDLSPQVQETFIQVPNEGQFILATDTQDLGNGFWHYEYALYNMNSDRAALSFSVPVDAGASVINIGFHDVDYHSFEIYDGTDWTATVTSGAITWSTTPFSSNANANALRWGTLYNYRFDANVPPAQLSATIELFKPGTPTSVQGLTFVPATPPPECGNDTVEAGEQCEPPDGVICDSFCQTIVNDPIRGGLLWDKWWIVNSSAAPAGNHPLYPPAGQQNGSSTFRCKECHGWDYKGVDGAYGSGSHFTGIPGVFGTTQTPAEMYDIIKGNTVTNAHNFESYGLGDQDTRDLVQFILDLALDTDSFIDGAAQFIGDPVQGGVNYTSVGSPACTSCHGADGATINFGTPLNPKWVGTISISNPWELLHKTRIGHPGSPMPSWLAGGGTDQGAADIGRFAQLNLLDVCQTNAHCDDGLFCNGTEACSAGSCLPGANPCPNQPCNETDDMCGVADAVRGGRLWDKWWKELGLVGPTGTHPLYPPAGQQTGSETFRCAECHGWDYEGVSGAYASGPHFTGIPGVLGTTLSTNEIFDLVKRDDIPNGHGLGNYGISDNDIWDVVAFVENLAIDSAPYIDQAGAFIGNEIQGQLNYETGGSISCTICHGLDGTDINFGTLSDPEWVGTTAFEDPWKLFHKIRVGSAGVTMPSWLADGGTSQGASDIGRHMQLSFPVDCTGNSHCDDGLFCNGAETCDGQFCLPGVPPCAVELCDESIATCLSGLCDTPTVLAEDSRYITVSPATGTSPVALLVTGDPANPEVDCLSQYVQADGTLDIQPVFQTPAIWDSVFIHDIEIRPETTYNIRADCGMMGAPDLSFGTSATTSTWCDLDGNMTANGNDILMMVLVFRQQFQIATVQQADVEPCVPNGAVNGNDVLRGVLAFQRVTFDGMGCTTPCP